METLKEGTWYIKGCEELEEYFDKNDINFQGDFSTHGYYIENGEWDCNIIEHIQHLTELTYPEFIKLFEGGESKEDFAIYKRTFNKIPYPRVEWECNCGFKYCLNEGFEQDYRKDNFKEIRFPTGKCLKCKKEIRTQSLEIKEVLQVENTVFNIDFGGHVMAGLKIINGEIEVVGAINGYGNGISTDEIIITKFNQ